MRPSSRWGLVLTYSGLIVIFAAIILLSSTLTSRQTLLGHARNIMENIASYTIDKSSNYLSPARDAARLTLGLAQSNILSSKDAEAMEAYFYEQLFIYPQFSGIYYGTVDGEFIMASRYNKFEQGGFYTKIITMGDQGRKTSLIYRGNDFQVTNRRFDPSDSYDPRRRPWFQKAREAASLIWTAPYVFFTSKKPGITTANPVYGPDGQLRGVIGVDIALDELSTFLSTLKVGKNGLAFIMDESGTIVAYPDMTKLRQPHGDKIRLTKINELDDSIARQAYASLSLGTGTIPPTEPVFTSFSHAGENYHAMFASFNDSQWPWLIGIYLPEDDYLGTLKQNGLVNIGISVIAMILAGLIGLAVARRLDSARLEAEAADRAKSRFLARMSHEIRTPMNALLGASELLNETELTEEQQRYLKLFRNAGEVLLELVSDVLDLAKVEAGEVTLQSIPFSLREAVNDTCSVLSLGAQEKGIGFHCNVVPAVPDKLIGDPARIKQVLVNLIGNALKFTEKGEIAIRVEPLGIGEGDGVTLTFQIKDTGIGIPEAMHKDVFKSFTQVGHSVVRKAGGTGLGLAICRHLVELMGGTIDMVSEPGKGSTFRFVLPFERAEATRPLKPAGLADKPTRRTLHILLVDDDESNRLITDMFTKSSGHNLRLVEDGRQAVSTFSTEQFDLVLMDIEMPNMDGYEATRLIRELERRRGTPPVPIVALTAHANSDLKTEEQNAMFTEHLTKPIKKGDLMAVLDRYAQT